MVIRLVKKPDTGSRSPSPAPDRRVISSGVQPPGPPRRLRPVVPPAPVVARRVSPGRSERAARELLRELGHDVVDHGLERRAVLASLGRGQASPWEVCDAHPHLVAAARHHGVPTARSCPICKHPGLADVHFVYGETLRHVAGQAKTPVEVRRLAAVNGREPRRFDVYVVEVCVHCRWNHLLRSFVVAAAADGSPGGPEGLDRAAAGG